MTSEACAYRFDCFPRMFWHKPHSSCKSQCPKSKCLIEILCWVTKVIECLCRNNQLCLQVEFSIDSACLMVHLFALVINHSLLPMDCLGTNSNPLKAWCCSIRLSYFCQFLWNKLEHAQDEWALQWRVVSKSHTLKVPCEKREDPRVFWDLCKTVLVSVVLKAVKMCWFYVLTC